MSGSRSLEIVCEYYFISVNEMKCSSITITHRTKIYTQNVANLAKIINVIKSLLFKFHLSIHPALISQHELQYIAI